MVILPSWLTCMIDTGYLYCSCSFIAVEVGSILICDEQQGLHVQTIADKSVIRLVADEEDQELMDGSHLLTGCTVSMSIFKFYEQAHLVDCTLESNLVCAGTARGHTILYSNGTRKQARQ